MVLSFEEIYVLVGVQFFVSLPLVFFLGRGGNQRSAPRPPMGE